MNKLKCLLSLFGDDAVKKIKQGRLNNKRTQNCFMNNVGVKPVQRLGKQESDVLKTVNRVEGKWWKMKCKRWARPSHCGTQVMPRLGGWNLHEVQSYS